MGQIKERLLNLFKNLKERKILFFFLLVFSVFLLTFSWKKTFQKIVFAQIEPQGIALYLANQSGNNKIFKGLLPKEVKNIKALDENRFLYLGDLEVLDQGKGIYLFDAKKKSQQKILIASDGFLIETFFLSPDKQKVVFWEVKTEENLSFLNGSSRIWVTPINNPEEKKLVLEQAMTERVFYPLTWAKNKRIYLEAFSVAGEGQALGIFSLKEDGSNFREEKTLAKDFYSEPPIFSPSGRFLAFVSFNKKAEKILKTPSRFFRPVQLNSNQINIFDLKENKRKIVYENLQGRVFNNLLFSADEEKIVFREFEIENNDLVFRGFKVLRLTTGEVEKLDLPLAEAVYWFGKSNTLLLGLAEAPFSLGGLLGSYSATYQSLYLYDFEKKSLEKVHSDFKMQVVDILSSSLFSFSVEAAAESIKLGTFPTPTFSPTVSPFLSPTPQPTVSPPSFPTPSPSPSPSPSPLIPWIPDTGKISSCLNNYPPIPGVSKGPSPPWDWSGQWWCAQATQKGKSCDEGYLLGELMLLFKAQNHCQKEDWTCWEMARQFAEREKCRYFVAVEDILGERRPWEKQPSVADIWMWSKALRRYAAVFFANDLGAALSELMSLPQETREGLIARYLPTPLYLYPPQPTLVQVLLGGKKWEVFASPSGLLWDLKEKRWRDFLEEELKLGSLKPPPNLLLVKREDLGERLFWYGQKLGLEGREVEDFVAYWERKLPKANFYLIGHYLPSQAQELLGLKIVPEPKVKILAMMYFKPQVEEPVSQWQAPPINHVGSGGSKFPLPPKREGFTAVDFSGMIEF